MSSNWSKLKSSIGAGKSQTSKARIKSQSIHTTPKQDGNARLTPILGLDCEMVGVGVKERSALAQVCIINSEEKIVYLKYVKTVEDVKNYRTHVSGVTQKHLKDAPDFRQVQKEVAQILLNRTVVGHGLDNDFKALMLSHPKKDIRDTAKYPPYMRKTRTGKLRPRRLKTLAHHVVQYDIQTGIHDPAEDAIAALRLYKHVKKDWELSLRKRSIPPPVPEMKTLQMTSKTKHTDSKRGREIEKDTKHAEIMIQNDDTKRSKLVQHSDTSNRKLVAPTIPVLQAKDTTKQMKSVSLKTEILDKKKQCIKVSQSTISSTSTTSHTKLKSNWLLHRAG